MADAGRPGSGWRVLRRLLPAWYAGRFGDELWRTHVEAARGRRRGVFFWSRLAGDVTITALQLRLDELWRAPARSGVSRAPSTADVIGHQLAYALRSLRRSPGFALAVVLTLGLGIGATATLFATLDRILFSPPAHVRAPEEVHRIHVHGRNPFSHEVQYTAALTYPDYLDLEDVDAFDAVAAFTPMELTADVDESSEGVRAELVSASYFPLLGIRPHAGRFFTEAEDRIEGGAPVAVLGHGFWRRAFGADSQALGRELRIGKGSYRIVGVAPAGFTGVDLAPVDVWLPVLTAGAVQQGTQWRDARTWWWLMAVARVDSGRAPAAAEEATAAYRAGSAEAPGRDADARVILSPLIAAKGPLASRESQVARAVGALALLVLLIACANVANLMLARGMRRRRALAIQTAVGIGRGRLVGQLLAEALLLAAAAGALALGLTRVLVPVLFRLLIPDTAPAPGGLRLLAFVACAALAATLLVGLAPALRSTRFNTLEALRTLRESRRSSSARRGLLFAQAALSAVLVLAAGLFLRSLERARSLDMGVDTGAVSVTFELQDGTRSGRRLGGVSYDVAERLRSLPFVVHAGVSQLPPFQGRYGLNVLVNGDTVDYGARGPFYYTAGPGYLEAAGLRILRGRGLTAADDREGAAPVAIVNESFARAAFVGGEALGECLNVEPRAGTAPCTHVVGVVEDARPSVRAERANLDVYLPPHHPRLRGTTAAIVMVRTRGPADPRLDELRAVAAAASPEIRRAQASTLEGYLEPQLRPWRLGAALLTAFGTLALLVAAVGLYGALAFDVAQHRFELGVRVALGATRGRLVRAVTARALLVSGLGAGTGALAAMLLARTAEELLFAVSPYDASVYAAGLLSLALVAAVAAAVPAWRAVRTDPRVALSGD